MLSISASEPAITGNDEVLQTSNISEMESHHQMQFSVIPRTHLGGEAIPISRGYTGLT